MDALNEEHREKYRMAKIKLETEIQALQNEFQELKRNCLINTEKMDYNYQVKDNVFRILVFRNVI